MVRGQGRVDERELVVLYDSGRVAPCSDSTLSTQHHSTVHSTSLYATTIACVLWPAVSLIGLDDGNVTRVSRFANYLRNILPNSDIAVMEMGAKAIGRLALAESALTAEYVEFEVRRALEWLSQEKHEHKRHAAVSGRGCEWAWL